MQSIYRILTEIQNRGEPSAICIITETKGSTPLKAGAKMIVLNNKKIIGTIGGGNLEHKVIEDALTVLQTNTPNVFEHHLIQDHQMCCGGSVKIYIEPVAQTKNLYIFGAGHIGKEIIRYASPLDFHISLIDERTELFHSLPETNAELFPMNYKNFLPQLNFNLNTFIVICTHLHEYDREILAYCIRKPFGYLGMIGSKRKVAVTTKLFLNKEIATEDEIKNVDMPIGLDISAIGPSEIALSILAKVIAVKNHHDLNTRRIYKEAPINKENFIPTEYAEANSNSNRCW